MINIRDWSIAGLQVGNQKAIFDCLSKKYHITSARLSIAWACISAALPGDNQQRAFCRRYFLKSTDISSVVKFKISGSEHAEPVSAVSWKKRPSMFLFCEFTN